MLNRSTAGDVDQIGLAGNDLNRRLMLGKALDRNTEGTGRHGGIQCGDVDCQPLGDRRGETEHVDIAGVIDLPRLLSRRAGVQRQGLGVGGEVTEVVGLGLEEEEVAAGAHLVDAADIDDIGLPRDDTELVAIEGLVPIVGRGNGAGQGEAVGREKVIPNSPVSVAVNSY